MTRSVVGRARLLAIALAITAGCGGSLGGTGGHGGNGSGGSVGAGGAGALALTGTGGRGGDVGTGGLGGDVGGTTGAGGACAICSDPLADVAGCPAGISAGSTCINAPANSFCCTGNEQFECYCGLQNAECLWISTCQGTGGTTGAGGSGGSGAGGDIGLTGGSSGSGSGGVGGGSGGTAGGGGQGGVACGGTTCAAGQVCVHPSCGGGVAVCTPPQDGGTCPQGWTFTDFCSPTHSGCVPPPCDPPPPFCAEVPAACGGTLSCTCLPSNLCTQNGGSGSCAFISAGAVTCGSA